MSSYRACCLPLRSNRWLDKMRSGAGAVLQFFRTLQWDGAISQAMLQSMGTVLERCSDDTALRFVKSLTEAPSLISPLQVILLWILLVASSAKYYLLLY